MRAPRRPCRPCGGSPRPQCAVVAAAAAAGAGAVAGQATCGHAGLGREQRIPRVVHQLWMSSGAAAGDAEPQSPELRAAIDAWARAAREAEPCLWQHRVWNRSSVRRLLAEQSEPALLDGFERLAAWPEKQKDFFMYVVLSRLGGIFVDADVVPLRPLGAWLEESAGVTRRGLGEGAARLVVGLEAHGSKQEARDWRWASTTQLTAWAVAAAPGHPVLLRAAEYYLRSALPGMHAWAGVQYDHSIAMGPGLLTARVDEWLQETRGRGLVRLASVRGRAAASAAGDTLVLGIDGFGCGQPHSGSRPCNETPAALVQHLFFGAWKPAAWDPWATEESGRRRRRRTPGAEDWRLPAMALMAHARAAGIELPWGAIPLFFSRIVPFEPPLLPAPVE